MHYIIINEERLKSKKSKKKFDLVKEVFDGAGIKYEVCLTNYKGHAHDIAAEITKGSGNTLVVMGGDGTLHEVLNGFENFEDNALALIPVGTGNDFAASAGIPLNAKKAARIIADNPPRPIDFLELSSGLRSLNAVGTGIDVDILKRAYAGKNSKKSKYLHSLIVCLARFKSYDFTVKYDGKKERHSGLIAVAGNGRQFGGGIKICPQAKIDDGLLDLTICDFVSKSKILGALIKLMRGKINKLKEATVVKTKSVTFIPHGEYSIQADGELYENNGLEVRVSDKKLLFHTAQI